MIREALCWVDEHRPLSATIVLGLAALGVLGLVAASAGGSSEPSEAAAAAEFAQVSDLIEEAQEPGAVKADPNARVSIGEPLRERIERAEESGGVEIGRKLERVPEPTSCSALAAGAVADVTVTGRLGCKSVSALVDAYRSGPEQGRIVEGFSCSSALEALQVSCARSADAANVALLFGPGGAGLANCGQSPVSAKGELARVRASGIGCNGARARVFAAVSGGEPTEVDGFTCERASIVDVATVSCENGEEAIAFTVPEGA